MLKFTNVGEWGLIPDFLSVFDQRSAVDQIHDHYHHGGGWRDVTNTSLQILLEQDGPATLIIGDERFSERARGRLRDEELFLFDCEFVAVWCRTKDKNYLRVARIN